MSAKHAVLGLVIERSGYGYQLVQRMEERYGSWRWSSTAVYVGLDKLARDDLVRVVGKKRGASAERSAPRAIYAATPQGAQYFDEWMRGCPQLSPWRQDLELKILLARPQDLGALIDMTWAQEQMCAERLRELGEGRGPRDAASWQDVLVRDAEIKHWRTRMEWLQEVRDTIKAVREGARPSVRDLGGLRRLAVR